MEESKSKLKNNLDIEINEDIVFPNISRNNRQLDLNVEYSKCYDTNYNGAWEYAKTFKRIEKYNSEFRNQIISKSVMN